MVVLFIWHNSLQTAVLSDSRSLAVLAMVRKWAVYVGMAHPEVLTNHMIRKAAHVFEYFLLGNSLRLALQYVPSGRALASVYTVLIGLVIASIDEYLQLFSPGRGAQVQDVGIDTCGVLLGCLVMSGLLWVWRRKVSS